jgi:curli biogenesis system outer membrane secretion channel CsgG
MAWLPLSSFRFPFFALCRGSRMSRLKLTGIALAFSLAGCASGPAPLSQQEISAAQQAGNLENLYDQYAARLAGQKLTSAEGQKAQEQLRQLGSQLAAKQEQEIRSELNQQATASGRVPLPVIDAQIARLPRIQKWAPEKHTALAAELNELRGLTQARITSQQNQLARLTENEQGQRVALLDDLAKLSGDERYVRERAEVVAALRRKAEAALKNEQYGEARQALTALKQAAPEDQNISTQLTLADARLFERKFWDSLSEGQLDEAYTQFMSLAQTAEFPEILKRLSKSSDDMVGYFEDQASVALAENQLADAYKLLSQARDLRSKSKSSKPRPPQEEVFLKAAYQRYQAALKTGQSGLALGYLKAMERFNPDYPGLRASLRTTQDATLTRATKKVSTAAFTDSAGNAEFGSAVAAKVTQHLFEKIPNDIRIIERDQFQAILREKEIGAAQPTELASADLLIQGTIESRVDTTEKNSKKTMRVVTETATVPNPEHAQWSALPEAQRAKQTEPARTLTQEKKEDVSINLQIIRKVGIISASYRLVEARTGKVLASGSESAKEEFTDEGNEGIELGHFSMPLKLASLPADTEILQKLTEKISGMIGAKLVQQLKDPELRYAEAAKRFAEEGDAVMAAENAAYVFALANLKGQDTTVQRLALEQYAMKAP